MTTTCPSLWDQAVCGEVGQPAHSKLLWPLSFTQAHVLSLAHITAWHSYATGVASSRPHPCSGGRAAARGWQWAHESDAASAHIRP